MLEFKENQSERLLIPRDIASCEMNASPDSRNNEQDICLYTFVPFGGPDQAQAGEEGITPTLVKSPAVIRISKAPKTLWTMLRAWVHEDAFEPAKREAFLEKVRKSCLIYVLHCIQRVILVSFVASNFSSVPSTSRQSTYSITAG